MRRCLLLALPPVLWAAGASAELTPEDVWAHQQSVFAALGATLSGTALREGDSLRVSDATGSYTLPAGLGSVRWAMGEMEFTDLGDGTVRHTIPEPQLVTITLSLPALEGFEGEIPLSLSYQGYDSVISGAPGDVTTQTRFDRLVMEAGDYEVNLDLGAELPRLDFFVMVEGSEAVYRVRDGAEMTIEVAAEAQRTVSDFAMSQFGADTKSVSESFGSTLFATLVVPRAAPVDPMNLGPALRAGLSLTLESGVGRTLSQNVSYFDGELVSDDRQSFGEVAQTLGLDRSGLRADGGASDIRFEVRAMPFVPEPILVTLAGLTYGLAFPLLDDPEPQEARFALALSGVEGSEALWGLLGAVSDDLRGPANADLSLRARLRLLANLTDALVLGQLESSPEAPFELLDAELVSLGASFGGATLQGSGAVTFEEGTGRPGPAFQPPTGGASFILTGAEALLDKLARSGLVSPADIAAVRAGLAGFFRPVGEDRLESIVTFEPGGRVLVNGAPMPF